jgi:predicted metal-binding membrane protein
MGSSTPDLTSRILRREKVVVAAGLALLTALSWWFLANGAGVAGPMGMMAAAPPPSALILMWWLMMVAMMVPSAAPMILLYAQAHRARIGNAAAPPTAAFLLGYLACWLAFALAAAAAQLWLQSVMLTSPMSMALRDPMLQGSVLIAAGAYQLSPLKNACLAQCRSPAAFLVRHYRPGAAGALRMGMVHGAYCVGCCWLLMLLLFVGGVMNIMWVVALALLVAAEKLLPKGEWIARLAGAALVAWGLLLLL